MERGDAELIDALVLAHDRKGRTGHSFLNAQTSAHSLGERCLARAKKPAQQHDVARTQQRGEGLSRRPRLLRARGVAPPTHGASMSRRTTPRSARIVSTTLGPPRNA